MGSACGATRDECTIVRIAQRHLQVGEVVEERTRYLRIPFISRQGKLAVVSGSDEVSAKAWRG